MPLNVIFNLEGFFFENLICPGHLNYRILKIINADFINFQNLIKINSEYLKTVFSFFHVLLAKELIFL